MRRPLVPALLACLVLLAAAPVSASTNPSEEIGTTAAITKKSDGPWAWLEGFRSSSVSLTQYVGTGNFVPGDADEPYLSTEVLLYPKYRISRYLSARLSFAFECVYGNTDRQFDRACSPSDTRLSLHHSKLWTDPLLGGTFSAYGAIYLPTSFTSQNNRTITNIRLSGAYLVTFFKRKLDLYYSFAVQKYLPASRTRDPLPPGLITTTGDVEAGVFGGGGPYNNNWLFFNNLHVGVQITRRVYASIDFLIYNTLVFTPGRDAFTPVVRDGTGATRTFTGNRHDSTRGIVQVSYQALDWLSLTLGIDSVQPALKPDAKTLRFPFFPIGEAASNYTKWYLAAEATY